jgi:hypothetical protein
MAKLRTVDNEEDPPGKEFGGSLHCHVSRHWFGLRAQEICWRAGRRVLDCPRAQGGCGSEQEPSRTSAYPYHSVMTAMAAGLVSYPKSVRPNSLEQVTQIATSLTECGVNPQAKPLLT